MADKFTSDSEKTLQYQDSLPSLPAPDLDVTLRKYLESVKPHVTDDEYQQTKKIVDEFGAGTGKTLHDALLKKIKGQRNWLEKIWEDKAYLESRIPINPLVSIASHGPFVRFWPPAEGTQVERAALILHHIMEFRNLLRTQKLKAEKTSDKTQMCMNQFMRLFNSCRIPGFEKDQLNFHFKTEDEGSCSTNIIILCKGRIFYFDTCTSNGELLTPPELQKQLQFIRDKCDKETEGLGLSALTCGDRTSWAKMYKHLQELHPDNKDYLKLIETAVIVVALDDTTPAPNTTEEMITLGLCGNAKSRWADKVTGAIFTNGTSTYNADHAPYDGLACGYLLHFTSQCLEAAGGKWQGSAELRKMEDPQEIKFHIDDLVSNAITDAAQVHQKNCANIALHQNQYKKFGKNLMKKVRIHPVAFCQLAVQLAYYRLYKKNPPTYETAGLRKFWHGRTETVRVVIPEIIKWTKTMLDESASVEQKLDALQTAYMRHVTNMTECANFKGCDRHLLALQTIAKEQGIETPELYKDKSYTASGGGGNFTLSTSCAGLSEATGVCAAMCENGYGVFYNITEESVNFNITGYKSGNTDCYKLFESIEWSIEEMAQLAREALGQ